MRYTLLNLDTYRLDTVHLREQECKDLWLSFEAKSGPRAKIWRNTALDIHQISKVMNNQGQWHGVPCQFTYVNVNVWQLQE